MIPRPLIIKHIKRAPSIPSRRIPRIRDRTRERTPGNPNIKVRLHHNPKINRPLKVKRQVFNHPQRLLIPLRHRPLMHHIPSPLLPSRLEDLDLLRVPTRQVHERLLHIRDPELRPRVIEGFQRGFELHFERGPDVVLLDAEVHAVEWSVYMSQQPIDDLAARPGSG